MAKKRARRSSTKTVKLKLTPAQRAQLSRATKGQFTTATFSFPKGKVFRPPTAKASCTLARLSPSVLRSR